MERKLKAVFLIWLLVSAEGPREGDDIVNGSCDVSAKTGSYNQSTMAESSNLLDVDSRTFGRQLDLVRDNAARHSGSFHAIPARLFAREMSKRFVFAHPGFVGHVIGVQGVSGLATGVIGILPAAEGAGKYIGRKLILTLLKRPGFTSKLMTSPLGRFGCGMMGKIVRMRSGGVVARFIGPKLASSISGMVTAVITKGGALKALAATTGGGSRFVIGSILSNAVPILNIASWALTAYQVFGIVRAVRAAHQAKAAADAARIAANLLKAHHRRQMVTLLGGAAVVVSILAITAVVMARNGVFDMWKSKNLISAFCPKSAWAADFGNAAASAGNQSEAQAHSVSGAKGMAQCPGLQRVEVGSVCGLDDIACHRAVCEQACCETSKCKLFQFRTSEPTYCYLGDGNREQCDSLPGLVTNDDDDHEEDDYHDSNTWYGGSFKGDDRFCPSGQWVCRSSGYCVSSCAACEGYSLGQTASADEAQECRRAPEQAMCNAANWVQSYVDAHDNTSYELDAVRCKGLIAEDIRLEEKAWTSGHDICQEACCADPDCVLYQVDASLGVLKTYEPKKDVRCWLGKVDLLSNPLFKCSTKQSGWTGRFLAWRGCSGGTYSCVISDICVQDCAGQCAGAPEKNVVAMRCDPRGGVQPVSQIIRGEEDEKARNAEAKELLEQEGDEPEHIVTFDPVTERTEGASLGSGSFVEEEGISPVDKSLTHSMVVVDAKGSFVEEEETSSVDKSLTHSMVVVDAKGLEASFFLAKFTPDKEEEVSFLAEIPIILDQLKESVLTPSTSDLVCSFLKTACYCKVEEDMDEEDCHCMAEQDCTADPAANTCTCTFEERQPSCDDWFYGDDHLIPIVGKYASEGLALLFGGKGCSCPLGEKKCSFGMLSKLPAIRIFKQAIVALNFHDT